MIRDLHNRPGTILLIILGMMLIGPLFRALFVTEQLENEKSATDSSATRNIENRRLEADDQEAPSSQSASSPELQFPLGCVLGESCWVARYMDREAGETAADHQCGSSTQNGHKGTDIALSDLMSMEAGVSVLAAAPGTVLRLRDGIADVSARETGANAADGQECGNGIVIDHGNGWQTQYCHMKRGSLKVRRGNKVKAGDAIGQVGMSGLTEYPHLHFSAHLNGTPIDPFDGGEFETSCNADGRSLWRDKVPYQSFAQLPAQFSTEPKDLGTMWQPGLNTMASDSPAMLLVGRGFHPQRGDVWHFAITDPDGNVALDQKVNFDKNHQVYVGYMGLKRPKDGFKPGIWKGSIRVDHGPWDDYDQTIEIEVTP